MPVAFRNVDASPTDDVRTWPYEALVAVIDRGLIVAEGTPDTLGGRATARAEVRFTLVDQPVESLPVPPALIDGSTVEYHSDDPTTLLHTLTGWAVERNTSLNGLSVSRPSLEDIYLGLTDGETP